MAIMKKAYADNGNQQYMDEIDSVMKKEDEIRTKL